VSPDVPQSASADKFDREAALKSIVSGVVYSGDVKLHVVSADTGSLAVSEDVTPESSSEDVASGYPAPENDLKEDVGD
jgi:hypothetical protein